MNVLLNICIYQAIWFLCVLFENTGALLSLPLLMLHLHLSRCKREDVKLMAILLLLGGFVDGLLHMLGFVSYNVTARPIPFWLAVIWLALATLPNHSLSWMKKRYFISAAFGFFGGPLAYWAGVKFGAADFNKPLFYSLLVFAVSWTVIWPLSIYIANKIKPKIHQP